MDEPRSSQPVSEIRLEEIATNACDSTFQSVQAYQHSQVESWNTAIINTILQSLIAETSTDTQGPLYKFTVTNTIVQHTTQPPPIASEASSLNGADQRNSVIGRRGMHSASGAYWNNERDGMWNWKYAKGEEKGFDVVLSVIWISIL
ncbi:hypothetical protein XANCAGTX0491_004566 [Xanthoria calcicola]